MRPFDLALGVMLLTTPMVTQAGVLTCQGTTFITGEASDIVFTVSLAETGVFRTQTQHGFASGLLDVNETWYAGEIAANDGTKFKVELNRYTGELTVMNIASRRIDHMGTCVKKPPRF